MPIVALQQNITSLREGMVEGGRIRKGAPKKKNAPGEDLPYFRIELNAQFAHLEDTIRKVFAGNGQYSEGPEWFLGAHVLEDTADKAFSFWNEQWGKGGTLYHRCDGEKQHQHWDGSGYSFARINCAASHPANPCACQRIGRLNLWFEPIVAATGEFIYFTVFTSSKNDIVNVQKQLQAAEYMAARAGLSLISVPFIFGRWDKAISSPAFKKTAKGWESTGGRTMVTKSLFSLRPDPTWNVSVLLPAIQEAKFLPPPTDKEPGELRLADAVKTSRILLGTGGTQRRIGGNGNSHAEVAVAEPEPEPTPDMQDMTPPPDDLTEDDAIEADFEEVNPEPWSKDEQTAFYFHWQGEGLSDAEMLKALGVKGLGGWKDSRAAADERVNGWIEEQSTI